MDEAEKYDQRSIILKNGIVLRHCSSIPNATPVIFYYLCLYIHLEMNSFLLLLFSPVLYVFLDILYTPNWIDYLSSLINIQI